MSETKNVTPASRPEDALAAARRQLKLCAEQYNPGSDEEIVARTLLAMQADAERMREALLNIKSVKRWRDIGIDTVACSRAIQDCAEMHDIADDALEDHP